MFKKSVHTKPFPLFGCKHQRPLYHFITSLYLSAGCSTFLHRYYAEFIFYRPDHLALDLRVDLFVHVEFSYIYNILADPICTSLPDKNANSVIRFKLCLICYLRFCFIVFKF